MCFSAEASFGAAAALLPVGLYCAGRAARRDVRFLPLGLTPLAFAVQQGAEGFVWVGLSHDDPAMVERGAQVFLFFALAFWPFWIPFSLFFPEGRRPARAFLAAAAGLSAVWFWMYAPLASDPGRWLSTGIFHHSIAYEYGDLPAFHLMPRPAWRVAYLVFICAPLLIARPGDGGGRLQYLGGALVAMLFAVTYLVFGHAFISVWCFFAALVSLLLAWGFSGLEERRRPGSR
jgi:hypothetical protein